MKKYMIEKWPIEAWLKASESIMRAPNFYFFIFSFWKILEINFKYR